MTSARRSGSLEMPGLDGTNPLGFLAALGTLVVLRAAGETDVRLGWQRAATWRPVLDGLTTDDRQAVCARLVRGLRGKDVAATAEQQRAAAYKRYESARTARKRKLEELKKRGLKGKDRSAALAIEVGPLDAALAKTRTEWLQALAASVPQPELALGERLDCTGDEYREHAAALAAADDDGARQALDLLAAFGTDACRSSNKSVQIEPTPFCFIKGSGNQNFLDTVRKLIGEVRSERIASALFEPWTYQDSGLSMRWDPAEDKRYALSATKPADEGASTVWMANLLAYRGMVLFPCAPTREGLGTTAWASVGDDQVLTWPIWRFPADPDTIRSLLQVAALAEPQPAREAMRARGIDDVLRARKIRYPPKGSNYKLNFSPGRSV